MRTEVAELAQALLRKDEELEEAKQATRDLAAWTLNERNRLVTEVLHQRLLREDYEAILRKRDEQVVYLLALHQEVRLNQALTLVREGEVMGRPVSMEHVEKINEMRLQIGLPPIDQHGAVQSDPPLNKGTQEGVKSSETMQKSWFVSKPQENKVPETAEEKTVTASGWSEITKNVLGTQKLEEGQVAEDEEGAYSPPGFEGSTSITDQVDELIAEEKGRLASW